MTSYLRRRVADFDCLNRKYPSQSAKNTYTDEKGHHELIRTRV